MYGKILRDCADCTVSFRSPYKETKAPVLDFEGEQVYNLLN